MNSLHKYFQSCLDLPNVLGAFCLNSEGELIEQFMPPPYDDEVFDELGSRIHALLEAVDSSYTPHREFLIRFESHCLFIRKSDSCSIGVFCAGDPVLAGLRVTINLLLKKAESQIADFAATNRSLSDGGQNQAIGNTGGGEESPPTADEEDDVVIVPAQKLTDPSEGKPKKREGFFSKKDKKPKSKDIWG